MNIIEIKSPYGLIKGLDYGDYSLFKGIRYAKAERFEYPEPITSYYDIYDATNWGDCSYQQRAFEEDAKCNPFYHHEFREGMSFSYSEDCLFLNIWAPKKKEKCPVIVYIHGGSFTGGSGNEGHISGERFAKHDTVFVSINYRLGPFGFISHPDLRDKNGRCGNMGLYDQTAALQWVKANIESFGGDSENICIMGQSAGAMSCDIHLSSKLSKGLFNKAILMSGAGLQRFMVKPLKVEDTRKFWDIVVQNAGVSKADELRDVDAKTLYYAWLDAQKQIKMAMKYTFPVIDGEIIGDGTFNADSIPDMPYILGMTITDMIPAILVYITKKWAEICQKNNNNCYVYNFNRLLPGDDKGAWHSADLLYAFSTLDNNWRPFEDIDRKISSQMSDSFIAFARNGNPNCDSMPCWDDNYKRPMKFCESTQAGKWEMKELVHNTLFNMMSI